MPDAGMAAICDDLAAETVGLVALVGDLDEAGWNTPTPAPRWAIRDQLAHLAYFDRTAVLAASDPAAFAVHLHALSASPDPGGAATAEAEGRSGADVLAWLTEARSQLLDALRRLDPKVRIPWYGPPMAATSFATARLMETWAHGQDVADALGVRRLPTDRLRHVAHITVRARAFSYAVHQRRLPEEEVRVVLTAPSGATWTWNDEAGDENVVRGSALDFCLVGTQRRHVADTALDIRGPLATEWIAIAQAFAGPPGIGRAPGQFAP